MSKFINILDNNGTGFSIHQKAKCHQSPLGLIVNHDFTKCCFHRVSQNNKCQFKKIVAKYKSSLPSFNAPTHMIQQDPTVVDSTSVDSTWLSCCGGNSSKSIQCDHKFHTSCYFNWISDNKYKTPPVHQLSNFSFRDSDNELTEQQVLEPVCSMKCYKHLVKNNENEKKKHMNEAGMTMMWR